MLGRGPGGERVGEMGGEWKREMYKVKEWENYREAQWEMMTGWEGKSGRGREIDGYSWEDKVTI